MRHEHNLYVKATQTKTPEAIHEHKKYKCILDKLKRRAKSQFLVNQFEKSSKDSRKTWDNINKYIKKSKKSKNDISTSFIIDNKETKDTANIVEAFNSYFNEIGPNLAQNIPPPLKNFRAYLGYPSITTFQFQIVSEHEIIKITKDLKPKFSSGPDQLPTKVLKDLVPSIIKPLTNLINRSLLQGYVHQRFKESIIIPLHKGERKDLISNYRPISLINSMSKILEKIVYKQLFNYLNFYCLFYSYQFGFRKHFSTEMAMAELLKKIGTNKLENKTTCAVFIDLAKAFDTVNFDILLCKLERYGIINYENLWFKNYLTGRTHQTKIKENLSAKKTTQCGVPQGSILGPLLFLIYINDLPKVSNLYTFFLQMIHLFYIQMNAKKPL